MDRLLNPDLLGCPLYRHLMPKKWDIILVEIFYPLFITAFDAAGIWLLESREVTDIVDKAKNVELFVLMFAASLMFMFLWVYHSKRAKNEYRKRAERLNRIPEADFWELDAEISMSELQYGSFYFLNEYLYAPRERLLIRYENIDTWQYGDSFSMMTGILNDQFLNVTEADGFKTLILIRERAKLMQERDQVRLKLDYKIMNAKDLCINNPYIIDDCK